MERSEDPGLPADWMTSSVSVGWFDVRSYKDSNGDGMGDLQGLALKLDYLKEIGVGAIVFAGCLQPTDFAYAGTMITRFCDIDPRLGTLEDFDRLVIEAHKRGIALIDGWAPYSTHPDHLYFQASRDLNHPRHEEFADYYVWADDPNTRWFRGWGHWEWDDVRARYFHTIWQTVDKRWCPETNPYSERMRKENEKVIRFWLERGLDGFWIDCGGGGGTFRTEEDRVVFEQEMNRLIHSYLGKVSIAEGGPCSVERTIYRMGYDSFWCMRGRKIPVLETIFRGQAFTEGHQGDGRESHGIHEALIGFYSFPKGNQCLNLCGLGEPLDLDDPLNVARVKQFFALAATLPLSPMFPVGSECGFFTFSKDYARGIFHAPMMWSSGKSNYGFTTAEPYAKVNPHNYPEGMMVENQLAREDSILNCFRKLMNLRNDNSALQSSESVADSYGKIPTQDDKRFYAFVRSCKKTGQRILVVFNLQDTAERIHVNFERTRHKVRGESDMLDLFDGEPTPPSRSNIYSLLLPAHGFTILEMKSVQER